MAVTAATLLVKVNADTSLAQRGLGGMAALLSPGGLLAAGALGATAAVAGIGVASVKMAGDFQAGMTSLVTGAGESASNLGLVSNGILDMAVQTGTSTSQLTAGMYMIESAGYHGAAGLNVLKAAAEGAKVGNADLGTVADATTTIMKDYPNVLHGASGAVNTLIATVANGKTHMQDLATSLAQILPTSSAAHIGLQDVMGAMATMTGEGVPAANAATYLRQTILALQAPSKGTESALKAVGLSSSAVATEMKKSLPDALKMITDAVGKHFPEGSAGYVAALKNIAGGSKQMQGVLDLTGAHMKDFQQNTLSITGAVKKGGNSITGWSQVQGDFNQKMDVAREVFEKLMIQLGTKLLPVLGNLVSAFATNLPGAINAVVATGQNIIKFFKDSGAGATAVKAILVVLGGALAGLGVSLAVSAVPGIIASVAAFGAQAVAAGAAAVATLAAALPFILVGAAIALVVVGIYELVTHWKQVSAFLTGVWHAVITGVGAGFSWLGGEAHKLWTTVQTAFTNGVNAVKALVHDGVTFVVGLFSWLYEHNYYFQHLVDAIRSAFTRAKAFITTTWTTITHWITGTWNKLVATARLYFELVYVEIEVRILRVKARLEAIWNTIHADVVAVGTRIHSAVTGAWNSITSFIGNLLSPVKSAVKRGVVDPLTSEITGMLSVAETWGHNLIQSFISGISGMAGALKNAAVNTLGGLAKILGFHSPAEEGPGADADTWAPNLMRMFAAGLIDATPTLASAAAQAMVGVKGALTGHVSGGTPGIAAGSGSLSPAAAAGLLAPSAASMVAQSLANGGARGGASGQPIILMLDGRAVARGLLPYHVDAVRTSAGIRVM